MREAADKGIRIYLIYGSHDYTANTTSLIDVIGSTGLFKKVFVVDSESHLDPVVDKETGAELMGINGRTQALERGYYPVISAVPKGRFNIFLFHTAISELRPDYIPQEDSIPQSALPQGFDYYAGGHLHERLNKDNIYYPGPLFGADFRDLSARKDRGFYLVHVDGKLAETEFVTVSDARFSLIDLDFSGIDSKKASELLKQQCSGNFSGIVLLNLHGKLSGGSVADIEVNAAKEKHREQRGRVRGRQQERHYRRETDHSYLRQEQRRDREQTFHRDIRKRHRKRKGTLHRARHRPGRDKHEQARF